MEHTELQTNVRILATLKETEFSVISCYLNAEQGITTCRNYLAEKSPLLRRTMPASQQKSFDQPLEHIQGYVEENVRDPYTRGIAVFARSVEDPFLLGMRFSVKEEMVRLAEGSSCGVMVVRGSDFLLAGGGVGCLTRY